MVLQCPMTPPTHASMSVLLGRRPWSRKNLLHHLLKGPKKPCGLGQVKAGQGKAVFADGQRKSAGGSEARTRGANRWSDWLRRLKH